jgi:Zn finger protein HypA/HybF involved in hydrogenase expression
VPVRVRCRACRAETGADAFPLSCGRCGELDVEVTQGEEFQVVALEVEEEVEVVGS